MSNFDSDSGLEGEWDERGDLVWNEFDWERYLREQDEAIQRYLKLYESCAESSDRIDEVAEKMNWSDSREDESEDDDEDESSEAAEVYTLHKNPIFIATKAIFLGLGRSWQSLASDSSRVPQPLAIALLAAMHRAEEHAVQAIHALDFGDFAMAVSLFKRALSALNGSLALLNSDTVATHKHIVAWREEALKKFFDLREIWLRVMAECREELDRPLDDEN